MNELPRTKLLIVDDEEDMLRLLKRSLSVDLDSTVATASNAYQALALMESERFDVVLADIRMPGMDGMEFLGRTLGDCPEQTVVMMTAYGTINLAVQAIKKGAYDFITKPFEHEALVHVLEKALERSKLVRENLLLQKRIREQEGFQQLVGVGPRMQRVLETIRLVAQTDVTVLITGESGTGKDVAAKTIHRLSPRRQGAFVVVNCPNLPENILESELFGYKKGAFTNATQDKKGLFWEAQDGTVYLDEIGDISPTLQAKLLRVLQEKEIRPLGSTKSVKVDVRIIASTNSDLTAKLRDNTFREDLFYRLNGLSLPMPPLRERPEDVPLLAQHFLAKFCKDLGKQPKTISKEVMHRLMASPWRGNVRELENTVRRAVVLSPDEVIRAEDLDLEPHASSQCTVMSAVTALPYKEAKARVLERFHGEYIANLLLRNNNNVTRAAKECGLERQALQQVMRRFGIKPHGFDPNNGEEEAGRKFGRTV